MGICLSLNLQEFQVLAFPGIGTEQIPGQGALKINLKNLEIRMPPEGAEIPADWNFHLEVTGVSLR